MGIRCAPGEWALLAREKHLIFTQRRILNSMSAFGLAVYWTLVQYERLVETWYCNKAICVQTPSPRKHYELLYNQLDRACMRFWRSAPWYFSSRRSAPAPFEQRIQRYYQARNGIGRNNGRAGSWPLGRVGQGFLRHASRRADATRRQYQFTRPCLGPLWAGDQGNPRFLAQQCCPRCRSGMAYRRPHRCPSATAGRRWRNSLRQNPRTLA